MKKPLIYIGLLLVIMPNTLAQGIFNIRADIDKNILNIFTDTPKTGEVKVFYSFDSGSWSSVQMTEFQNGFLAKIPIAGNIISYFITIEDKDKTTSSVYIEPIASIFATAKSTNYNPIMNQKSYSSINQKSYPTKSINTVNIYNYDYTDSGYYRGNYDYANSRYYRGRDYYYTYDDYYDDCRSRGSYRSFKRCLRKEIRRDYHRDYRHYFGRNYYSGDYRSNIYYRPLRIDWLW